MPGLNFMTKESPVSEKQPIGAFLLDEIKKWAVRVLFLAVASALIYLGTPLRDRLSAIWQVPEQIAEIVQKLELLTTEVQRATGEDRVIYEVPGLTYVTEPVYVGDRIVLHMVARRTRTGAACTLLSRTALFSDETNIPIPGDTVPAAQQLGTVETPLRIEITVPPQVRSGRVTVMLSLEFDCGSRRVFDTTRQTPFALLGRREGR